MTHDNKVMMAETLSFFSDYKGGDECFKYGSTWGCDTGCPVLNAGKCKLKDGENKHFWEQIQQEQN